MKSNDEGTNTTAFALCTADFMTEGSNYMILMNMKIFKRAEGARLRA